MIRINLRHKLAFFIGYIPKTRCPAWCVRHWGRQPLHIAEGWKDYLIYIKQRWCQ